MTNYATGRLARALAPNISAFMTSSEHTPSPDRPIYAIGDLHGRADLLVATFQKILDELDARGNRDVSIVALGDYVDRGEASRDVLVELMEFQKTLPGILTCLRGNHEKMMLDFLDEPEERGGRFLRYGGLQTLASFGVGGVTERARPAALVTASQALKDAMPEGMEAWLRDLPYWTRSGNVVCVHAAMDPAVPPEMQEDRPMLWGHPLFYKYERPDGLWIVHGHDVFDEPKVEKRRVSCDTGAYYTGRLSTAVIEPGAPVRFITT